MFGATLVWGAIRATDRATVIFEDSRVTGKRITKDKAEIRVEN